MFATIIFGNDGTPYVYGPFDTVGEAQRFALDHNGYRFQVAQFVPQCECKS